MRAAFFAGATGSAGFALPAVLFVMILLSALGMVALRTTSDERQASRGIRESTKAFYAAEAGFNQLWANWPESAVGKLAPGDSVDLGWQVLEQGSYRPVVYRTDAGGSEMFSVIVHGRGRGSLGGQRTLVRAVSAGSSSLFQYAVYADAYVNVGGGGPIIGNIYSTGDAKIDTDVFGDVAAGGIVYGKGEISGTVTEGASAPLELEVPVCPSAPYGPAPIGPGVAFDSIQGDLNIGGNDTTYLPAGTYYFHHFQKSGNGYVIIPGGGQVVIYASGKFQVGGNGFVNLSKRAGDIQVYQCGTADGSTWEYCGNGEAWLTMYAPTHKMALGCNGDKHGSFIGKTVEKGGNMSLVYDSTLVSAGGAERRVLPGSWSQFSY